MRWHVVVCCRIIFYTKNADKKRQEKIRKEKDKI
jgi:hypothetical protein